MSLIEKKIRDIYHTVLRKYEKELFLVISQLNSGTWNLRFDTVLIYEAESLEELLNKMLEVD